MQWVPIPQNRVCFVTEAIMAFCTAHTARGMGSEGQSPGADMTCGSKIQLTLLLSLGAGKRFSLACFHPSRHIQATPNIHTTKKAWLLS